MLNVANTANHADRRTTPTRLGYMHGKEVVELSKTHCLLFGAQSVVVFNGVSCVTSAEGDSVQEIVAAILLRTSVSITLPMYESVALVFASESVKVAIPRAAEAVFVGLVVLRMVLLEVLRNPDTIEAAAAEHWVFTAHLPRLAISVYKLQHMIIAGWMLEILL